MSDRSRWDSLSDEQLKQLLIAQLTAYGRADDESRIAPIRRVYEAAAQRLSVPARTEALLEVTELIEKHEISLNPLFAFIVADPSRSVISTAALNLAALMPLSGGEPLTGPRYLLQMARTASSSEVRVGILSGLFLLGDRRLTSLWENAWAQLKPHEQVELTNAHSGMMHAPLVDFWVERLSETDDRLNGEVFGAIAAALARLPAEVEPEIVWELRRKFPANAPGTQPEAEMLGRWTVEEYGRILEPKLRAIEERELDPKIIPRVLDAWGIPRAGLARDSRDAESSGIDRDIIPRQPAEVVMDQIAPFDAAVAHICQGCYDAATPLNELAWRGVAAGMLFGLDLGLDDPEERERLLAEHPNENPRTSALNKNMRLFNEVFADPQLQATLTAAAQKTGREYHLGVVLMLIERFKEVHGEFSEQRRMLDFAALANHAFRFGLMLARDHPDTATWVRASIRGTPEPERPTRKPSWKFW